MLLSHTRTCTGIYPHCMHITARKLDTGITSIKAKGAGTTGAFRKHYGLGVAKAKAKHINKLSNTGRAGPARGGSIH